MTISSKPDHYHQRFAQLKQRFRATLGTKAQLLVTQATQASRGELSQLSALIADSHQLAGSCGTFSYHQLGDKARRIEQMALALTAGESCEAAQWEQLLDTTQQFQQQVQQLESSNDQINFVPKSHSTADQQIWLLLDHQALQDELSSQLGAFDYTIRIFNTFETCLEAFSQATPALLYCVASLHSGHDSVFAHTELLKVLADKDIPWMVYSDSDDFELRIEAARHHAKAFYVSPLNVPAMLGRIAELMNQYTAEPGRVCIMDDDQLLADHYALTLQAAGMDCRVLTEPRTIIQDILHFQPELVLMDLHMPNYSGPELAGVIRQHDTLKSLPIVYLSAEQDQAQQLKAMAFGADDFLTKPISEPQLVRAVQVRLSRSRELRDLIEKDSLTGLMKHSAIKETVQLEYERAKRSGKQFSVVMLDIDHFKAVNDQYGHAIGDVVITTLATLLKQRIRRTDKAGRYGGEEFVLVLPDCSSDDALPMLQVILDSFRHIAFHAAGSDFYCSFSAGIACNQVGLSAEAMLNAADEKLYQAKSLGRNQVIA